MYLNPSYTIQFPEITEAIKDYFNNYALVLKIILVSILVVVAILSLPIVVTSGNVHFKHALDKF